MEEIWKDVKDYEGLYQVSNLGRVKSLDRMVRCKGGSSRLLIGHVMKHRIDQYGYCRINLCTCGLRKRNGVHRLVAQAFLDDYSEDLQVNHIDEVKTNNRVDNLNMMNCQQNVEYSQAKVWRFYNPIGELVEIYNLRKFCRENTIDFGAMRRVYMGGFHDSRVDKWVNIRQHKGWTKA